MPETSPLLTLKQLAELLQIPVQTLYVWRGQGKGPPGFKVGRAVRYRRSDVERWLERQADRDAAA